MTATATLNRAPAKPAALVTLKGKGKTQRERAFAKIAPLSLAENMCRADSIENMKLALGAQPEVKHIEIAKRQWLGGRVAARLPMTEFPKGADVSAAGTLAFAFDLMDNYAAPPKEGAKPRKLRAGQKGRRSTVQHRVIRNAEEAWSVFAAECGIGQAQTQAQRAANNATKGAKSPNQSTRHGHKIDPANPPANSKGVDVKPTLGAASAVKHTSREDVLSYVDQAAATLLAFANKNAKLMPTDYGAAIQRFKTDINKAANAEQERKAKAQAIAAEKMK